MQQIARDLAGYSLGKADILRRAMGKKDRKEMAAQRDGFCCWRGRAQYRTRGCGSHFQDTCAENSRNTASNKSHSAPYAATHVSDRLHMKANYPVEFMAASMTLEMGKYRQARRISR